MNASTIPYHLRPLKAVDRRLFLDLLNRFERYKPLSQYAYISMGAYPLEDHKMIHRHLGIRRLISFDMNQNIVNRQAFNKPVNSMACILAKSGDVIDRLDRVLTDAGAGDCDGRIFWLDYTEPAKIGEQIREFQTLLDKLSVGDIIRVTVNAHPPALGDNKDPDDPDRVLDKTELQNKRFAKLTTRIGDYLTTDVDASFMTEDHLPIALAKAFGQATAKALPPTGDVGFLPMSIVRYADGHQMLSITGCLFKKSERRSIVDRIGLAEWPFASLEWNKVHSIYVPDLTIRERMLLDRAVATGIFLGLKEQLGFTFPDVDLDIFLENYKNFYRFYPSLLSADL